MIDLEAIATQISDAEVEDAEMFRKKKETAILVILFLDIVHSTALREEMGEVQFDALLKQQKRELRAIIEQGNHGKVIKDLGDGLLGVFAMPDVAVKHALNIQEALAEHPVLKVRIGVDMGQVTQELEEGIVKDVFGRHVNRAARLESLGDAGHILVSYPIWDSAKGWLKHLEQIRWKKHGSYWLKGLPEPQIVYEPYNADVRKPLAALRGEKVKPEDELTYCQLCGRHVKLKETCTCRTCGTADICSTYCYDAARQQCVECASKIVPESSDVPPPAMQPHPVGAAPQPVSQKEFEVLLSYAPDDQEFVLHLANYLKHEGVTVWIADEQIDLGDPISQKIEYGLRHSRFVVVCLSCAFSSSLWGRAEYANLLARETQTRNEQILPVLVGECAETAIPHWLCDKYAVDIRISQGLERLLRKLKSVMPPEQRPVAETPPEQAPPPQALRDGLHRLQQELLVLSKTSVVSEEAIVRFDKTGIGFLDLLEHFPQYFHEFHEVSSIYQSVAERMFNVIQDQELRRVLAFRFKKVELGIEDLAGGFSSGESFLNTADRRIAVDSPYACGRADAEDFDIEQGVQKLLSAKELDESAGIDWLLRRGFANADRRLQKIAASNLQKEVFKILWKRSARIFLYYNPSFWDVVKYMLSRDTLSWKLRFYGMKTLLKRELNAKQAVDILHNFVPAEQQILGAFLMVHPKRECREIALHTLATEQRWDILLCPSVPLLVVKELVKQCSTDTSDSYVKALFLLLRSRLADVDTPLAIGEAYDILKIFYHIPVFLQETFFQALIELHNILCRKAQADPTTTHLEAEFMTAFRSFCAKEKLQDVDITEMRHIPLPIQRKLAHDGHFPKYFICNSRDLIALETIPHVERRPDIVEFVRLRQINARALERLAKNKLLMQEYMNRSAFCHNPKASAALLRTYLSTLTRADIKDIARDRNVSMYARNLAAKYMSRENM